MNEVPKIYVVDDDPSVREAVGSLIRSAGLMVQTIASAQEVWSRAQISPPNCMVLDIELPGLSGLDLQEQLGKAHLPIPIIFLTGKADIPMSVRAMKAGAVEFLTKPFVGEYLLDAIQQAIISNRLTEDESGNEVHWGVSGNEVEPDRPKRASMRRKTAGTAG